MVFYFNFKSYWSEDPDEDVVNEMYNLADEINQATKDYVTSSPLGSPQAVEDRTNEARDNLPQAVEDRTNQARDNLPQAVEDRTNQARDNLTTSPPVMNRKVSL